MLHPFYDLYDQGRADARADVVARAPHRDNASKPHAYQVGYYDGRVVALQMADRGELTLAELNDAGSLHTAACPVCGDDSSPNPAGGSYLCRACAGAKSEESGYEPDVVDGPALYLEATEAGMQYSLVPPPVSKTRKGETQGRLF